MIPGTLRGDTVKLKKLIGRRCDRIRRSIKVLSQHLELRAPLVIILIDRMG